MPGGIADDASEVAVRVPDREGKLEEVARVTASVGGAA